MSSSGTRIGGAMKKLIAGIGSIAVLLFLGIALVEAYLESRERERELWLQGDSERFEEAAAGFLAEGRSGEEKLLALARDGDRTALMRLRAALTLATGKGETGTVLRRQLFEPCDPRSWMGDLQPMVKILESPTLLDGAAAVDGGLVRTSGPAVPPGPTAADAEEKRSPVIEVFLERLVQRSLDLDLTQPGPDGRRKIILRPRTPKADERAGEGPEAAEGPAPERRG
jgi:hypothetical protein